MNKLLLSALCAMSAVQFSTPAMARNGADDPADHVHQGRGADDAVEHANHDNNYTDDHVRQNRRGRDESGHGQHGRRFDDPIDHDIQNHDADHAENHQ